MANLVFYRKYRPQLFSEVVGQEHAVRTISNAIAANAFAHAYLFSGPRGTGKTTLARLIAKSLNCQTRNDGEYEPCGKCGSCIEITKGIAPDVIEIDAASNRGIDEIRALKEGIRFSPVSGKYKIFIIDEVHMLTKEAFNALLKTLEEPPAHAVFVLATTELNKVLPTIISRSQKFELRKLTHSEIKERLSGLVAREKKKIDPKILDAIASRATGSIRDGESILGQVLSMGEGATKEDIDFLLGVADLEQIDKFTGTLASGDSKGALEIISAVIDKGVDFDEFLKGALAYLRWIMFLKVDPNLSSIIGRDISEDELAQLVKTAKKFDIGKLQRAAKLFMQASDAMRYSPIPQLPLELAVVELSSENSNN